MTWPRNHLPHIYDLLLLEALRAAGSRSRAASAHPLDRPDAARRISLLCLPRPIQLIAFARAAAVRHSIEPALVCAIAERRSAYRTRTLSAMSRRFRARYVAPLGLTPTEEIARSISWGLLQVMGQVARNTLFGEIPQRAMRSRRRARYRLCRACREARSRSRRLSARARDVERRRKSRLRRRGSGPRLEMQMR